MRDETEDYVREQEREMIRNGIHRNGSDETLSACRNNEQLYHELFLQNGGEMFLRPIMFEDGMDFAESELYYSTMEAQKLGGAIRRSSGQQRPRPLRALLLPPDLPIPILKKQSQLKARSQPRESMVRRCSFSGLLPEIKDQPLTKNLIRVSSVRGFVGEAAPRVSFQEHIQVISIHPLSDIPREVRSNLWISRGEMLVNMHNAANKVLEEKIAKREKEFAELLDIENEDETLLQRAHSSRSVVSECRESHAVGVF